MEPATMAVIGSTAAQVAGGVFGMKSAAKNNKRNIEYQKEFAQNGISWKVADGKKAGIHPLAAIGANTMSFSPTRSEEPQILSKMGQDVGRGIMAVSESKNRALTLELAEETVKGAKIDNEMRTIQLNSERARLKGINPPFPTTNMTDGQGMEIIPAAATESASKIGGKPEQTLGSVPSISFARAGDGVLVPVPSKDVKELIEDDLILETGQKVRTFINAMNGKGKPSKALLPKSKSGKPYTDWKWKNFAWYPVRTKQEGRSNMKPTGKGWLDYVGQAITNAHKAMSR